jgi:hypothetical protein
MAPSSTNKGKSTKGKTSKTTPAKTTTKKPTTATKKPVATKKITPKTGKRSPSENKRANSKSRPASSTSNQTQDENSPPTRYFKAIYDNNGTIEHHGRYNGAKPKQAANKALTAIKKKLKMGDDENIYFAICECTRGSSKKIYTYCGSQTQLDEPVTVTITKDGEPHDITYSRQNRLRKAEKTNENCTRLIDYYLNNTRGGSRSRSSSAKTRNSSSKTTSSKTTRSKTPSSKTSSTKTSSTKTSNKRQNTTKRSPSKGKKTSAELSK